MAKVFITGANGFIGTHLCQYFDKNKVSYKAGVRKAQKATEVSYGDLTTREDWSALLQGCDQIVHLAARAHVMQENLLDPLVAYLKINMESTIKLARSAQENGIKKFIFLSSIKVNGERTLPGQRFKADDPTKPTDDYANSKLRTEVELLKMHQPGRFEIVIIRPPLVYGGDVKGNLKSLFKIVKWQIPLPFANVNNQRSLVSVYNVCDLIMTCLRKPEAAGQIFLVSDDHDLSLRTLILQISKILKRPVLLLPVPLSWIYFVAKLFKKESYTDRLLGNLQVDIEKTKTTLSWKPPFTFEQTFQIKS